MAEAAEPLWRLCQHMYGRILAVEQEESPVIKMLYPGKQTGRGMRQTKLTHGWLKDYKLRDAAKVSELYRRELNAATDGTRQTKLDGWLTRGK